MSTTTKANVMKYSIALQTNIGLQREHNEDNFILSPNLHENQWKIDQSPSSYKSDDNGVLMIIADGMGGLNAGEVASHIAGMAIKEYFNKHYKHKKIKPRKIFSFLENAIHYANNDIIKHSKSYRSTQGMGTTVIIGLIKDDFVYIAWIGDSRAYLYRPTEGLTQISEDHSLVQQLINNGQISSEQAFFHPDSNIVTQSLGDNKSTLKVGKVKVELLKDDILLLCSDGLNGMLQDSEIESIIKHNSNDNSLCIDNLIEAANNAGGFDNITVGLVKVIKGKIQLTNNTLEGSVQGNKGSNRRTTFGLFALAFLFCLTAFTFFSIQKEELFIAQSHNYETIIPDVIDTKQSTLEINDPKKDNISSQFKNLGEGSDKNSKNEIIPSTPRPSIKKEPVLTHPSTKKHTPQNNVIKEDNINDEQTHANRPATTIDDVIKNLKEEINNATLSADDNKQLKELELCFKYLTSKNNLVSDYHLMKSYLIIKTLDLAKVKSLNIFKEKLENILNTKGLSNFHEYTITFRGPFSIKSDAEKVKINSKVIINFKEEQNSTFYFIHDKSQVPDFVNLNFFIGLTQKENKLRMDIQDEISNNHTLSKWNYNSLLNNKERILLSFKYLNKDNREKIILQKVQ